MGQGADITTGMEYTVFKMHQAGVEVAFQRIKLTANRNGDAWLLGRMELQLDELYGPCN